MNIAYVTIYGSVYEKDQIFNPNACTIGQNLLMPIIKLKEMLENQGHSFHTADMFELEEIDVLIFQDLSNNSYLTIRTLGDWIKYFVKNKRKHDYLWKSCSCSKKIRKILIMQEPEVVCPYTYEKRYHKYFDEILTWNEDFLLEKKYHKFQYPQPRPEKSYQTCYESKRFLTMIAGNKSSHVVNELYSARRDVIDCCEKNDIEFDLYGFGWEREKLRCYKGMVKDKLSVLSKYKFSICYENQCNIKGYITEKIFDCFFAGVVPVYWGAQDITKYIPEGCFIDRRKFESIESLIFRLHSISEDEYMKYIQKINNYLNSDSFYRQFSVEAYVNNMVQIITKLGMTDGKK